MVIDLMDREDLQFIDNVNRYIGYDEGFYDYIKNDETFSYTKEEYIIRLKRYISLGKSNNIFHICTINEAICNFALQSKHILSDSITIRLINFLIDNGYYKPHLYHILKIEKYEKNSPIRRIVSLNKYNKSSEENDYIANYLIDNKVSEINLETLLVDNLINTINHDILNKFTSYLDSIGFGHNYYTILSLLKIDHDYYKYLYLDNSGYEVLKYRFIDDISEDEILTIIYNDSKYILNELSENINENVTNTLLKYCKNYNIINNILSRNIPQHIEYLNKERTEFLMSSDNDMIYFFENSSFDILDNFLYKNINNISNAYLIETLFKRSDRTKIVERYSSYISKDYLVELIITYGNSKEIDYIIRNFEMTNDIMLIIIDKGFPNQILKLIDNDTNVKLLKEASRIKDYKLASKIVDILVHRKEKYTLVHDNIIKQGYDDLNKRLIRYLIENPSSVINIPHEWSWDRPEIFNIPLDIKDIKDLIEIGSNYYSSIHYFLTVYDSMEILDMLPDNTRPSVYMNKRYNKAMKIQNNLNLIDL